MNRPLRVATLFTQLYLGGDEQRVLTFARAHDRSRIHHVVLVMVEPSQERGALYGPIADRYREAGVEVVSLGLPERGEWAGTPLGPLRDARLLASAVRRLVRELRERRIDVVDARMAWSLVLGVLAAPLARVPVVVGTSYYSNFWSGPRRLVQRSVCSRLDAVITDSRACLAFIRSDSGLSLEQGVVIENGLAEPEVVEDRARVRAFFGIPDEATVIAEVAAIRDYKGQDLLLEAVAPLLQERPELHLLLCGYTKRTEAYGVDLERRVTELGLTGRVSVGGWPGRSTDVFAAIDVHAHPSRMDSSPISILEGMAAGLPAVVSDVGGIPELVLHEETGLVFPKDDVDALRKALLRVLDGPDLAARLGAAARARYEARHRPAVLADQTTDLLERLYARKAT